MSQPLRRLSLQFTTAAFALVAAATAFTGCTQPTALAPSPAPAVAPSASALPPDALVPSPRIIVGRILDLDLALGFAFVDLTPDAPAAALSEGTELVARTIEFRETGRLRASRYVRGRALGAKIFSGQPAKGDEVVWQAP